MAGLYYNSNGFAFHRIEDAVRILAELGYDGLALTPDVHHLDPFRVDDAALASFRGLLEEHGLGIVLETGARFVLDPARKHRPTLLDPPQEAHRRVELLCRAIDMAEALGAPVVSLWAGTPPEGLSFADAHARLVEGLRTVCAYAAQVGVRIGFEPEPGMLIERAAEWPALRDAVAHDALGLTLDVGHTLATRAGDPADVIRTHADDLFVLQLDDHRAGVHDHLMFGEGEVDWPRVAAAVADIGFEGPLEVELSRHSATAPSTAAASLAFLRPLFGR
ncbi:MAG: sugar phosphate isomerase/epimerase family protein [Planctomycetota bacterium]|nr:sugar phosphate isomerase/epimerase family protein [Planctomycetota bacterium]